MFASYKLLNVFVTSYRWMQPQGTTTTIPFPRSLHSRLWCAHSRSSSAIATHSPCQIQNAVIRIRTRALRTSPARSLCAEADLPPLHYQGLALSTSLLSSIAQLPATSIHDYLFDKICSKPKPQGANTHIRYYY